MQQLCEYTSSSLSGSCLLLFNLGQFSSGVSVTRCGAVAVVSRNSHCDRFGSRISR